jgi:hypothetical protein
MRLIGCMWLACAAFSQTGTPALPELLPQEKEVAMALSAAPEHLRAAASVYVLKKDGFVLAKQGTNGFACIVNRDHPLNQGPRCPWPSQGQGLRGLG